LAGVAKNSVSALIGIVRVPSSISRANSNSGDRVVDDGAAPASKRLKEHQTLEHYHGMRLGTRLVSSSTALG
jgi:hypothetical protein